MHRLLIAIFLLLVVSCSDDNFETPDYSQKIVVDGWIEQNQPARVFLTLSAPYFSEIDSLSIRKLVLTRAKVTVSDGNESEILTLRNNSDYFPPYIYEGTTLLGKIGQSYNLKVEYNGRTITATTQIPETQSLDSIWFKKDLDVDTAGYIMIRFTDKPGVENFYRILTRTGLETSKYTPTFLPNFDGRLIDGQNVTLTLSNEKNSSIKLFHINDTVSVKFCTIDKISFNYWSTLYNEINNSQNPFAATNARVKSNINGGLGGWTGYGVKVYRIVCK